MRRLREARGETPVGRKIGFTNRVTWPNHAPMWGYVYDRTVHELADIGHTFALTGLAEPRIEPEIGASNVLDGPPLTALRHLVDILAHDAINLPLAAGEIVTTGTLTAVPPVAPQQRWSTRLAGVALRDIAVEFQP